MMNNLSKKINNLMLSAQSSKENGNLTLALDYLNEALKLDPNNKKALNNIGNVYKEMKNFDKAVDYYSSAIKLDPNYLISKINLAILNHDLGNLESAEKIYKELIVLDKYNFGIYFNLSRINFDFFDQDRINFIEDTLNMNNLSNYNKASGYFILAKDQQIKKNFDKEMEYLKKGHNFYCKSIPQNVYEQSSNYWLNIIPKKYDKIKASDVIKREKKNNEINPIFIIGMPRSGSTLIESIISSGKLKIPNGGETATINWAILKNHKKDLFDKDLKDFYIDSLNLKKDIEDKYKNLNLLDKKKNFFFTDKSLENFFFIDIILGLFPNAKFIHCKRNKIDNILAIYQNFLTKMTWPHSLKDIIFYFDNYLKVMNYYDGKFKDKIFSIELEKFTSDSKNISQKMFEFCKLEWTEKSLEYHKRKDLFSTTASNVQIREKIYRYKNAKYSVYKKYIKEFEPKFSWLKKDL